MESVYLSSTFIVRYVHILVLSPYLLYVGYKFRDLSKTHSQMLMVLGAFAALYNYLVIAERADIFVSLSLLFVFLLILAFLYRYENIKHSDKNSELI
jgi:hypothetical protein